VGANPDAIVEGEKGEKGSQERIWLLQVKTKWKDPAKVKASQRNGKEYFRRPGILQQGPLEP
jgi:hypothetical protein